MLVTARLCDFNLMKGNGSVEKRIVAARRLRLKLSFPKTSQPSSTEKHSSQSAVLQPTLISDLCPPCAQGKKNLLAGINKVCYHYCNSYFHMHYSQYFSRE